MRTVFDPVADPSLSLVSNMADYGIPTSSFADTLQVGLAFYAALGRADIDYSAANSDPEIVFILASPAAFTPIAGTFYGINVVKDFLVKCLTVDGSRMDADIVSLIRNNI